MSITEVFGSNTFGNNGFSGIAADIFAIHKLKFCIKIAQSNGFSGVMGKTAHPQLIRYFQKPLYNTRLSPTCGL